MGTGCKPVGESLRWFKSSPAHWIRQVCFSHRAAGFRFFRFSPQKQRFSPLPFFVLCDLVSQKYALVAACAASVQKAAKNPEEITVFDSTGLAIQRHFRSNNDLPKAHRRRNAQCKTGNVRVLLTGGADCDTKASCSCDYLPAFEDSSPLFSGGVSAGRLFVPRTSASFSLRSFLSSSVKSLSRSMNSMKYLPPSIGILTLPT